MAGTQRDSGATTGCEAEPGAMTDALRQLDESAREHVAEFESAGLEAVEGK